MRHYQARQRQTDQRWDFTMSDGVGGHPVGYCGGYPDVADMEKKTIHVPPHTLALWEQHKDKFHTDGHATQEEAEECYRQYILDQRTSYDHEDKNQQRKCEVCGEWTTHFALVGQTQIVHLCDQHRNRESLDPLVKKSSQIWSS